MPKVGDSGLTSTKHQKQESREVLPNEAYELIRDLFEIDKFAKSTGRYVTDVFLSYLISYEVSKDRNPDVPENRSPAWLEQGISDAERIMKYYGHLSAFTDVVDAWKTELASKRQHNNQPTTTNPADQ